MKVQLGKQRGIAAAVAATALGILGTVHPAWAQFPTNLGESGATHEVYHHGQKILVPVKNNYFAFSPFITTFQFKNTTGPDSNGRFNTNKTTNSGTFLQIEKHISLEDTRQPSSSLSVGLWYWYHNSRQDNNPDRLGLYTQYNFNRNIAVQVTIGGSTRGVPSGLFEYYGFLLYSPTLPKQSRFGLQVGVGPYIPRRSVGSVGYTYTLGGVYKLTTDYSVSASYWKVNYNKPAGTFGTAIENDLSRANLSVVYNFK